MPAEYLRGTPDAGLLRQRPDQLRPRAVPAGARRARAAAAAAPERSGARGPDRRALHRVRVQDPGEHGSAPSRSRRVRPRLLRPVHEGHGGVQQPASGSRSGRRVRTGSSAATARRSTSPTRGTSSASSTRGSSRSATRSTPATPVRFLDLPRFPAEHFGRVRLQDTRYKQFDEGSGSSRKKG